jgi:hypothetical protein
VTYVLDDRFAEAFYLALVEAVSAPTTVFHPDGSVSSGRWIETCGDSTEIVI